MPRPIWSHLACVTAMAWLGVVGGLMLETSAVEPVAGKKPTGTKAADKSPAVGSPTVGSPAEKPATKKGSTGKATPGKATQPKATPAKTAASAKNIEFFEQHIRPILVKKCQSCHGGMKQESGLRLDSRAAVVKGGDSGPAVAPGNVEESLLIDAVRREGLEMPPDERLSDDEVAALERWVRIGAPWPQEALPTEPTLGDQVHIRRVSQGHWAFQPVVKPPVPQTARTKPAGKVAGKASGWVETPVDAFVLAKLEEQDIQPSPDADRRTLLRRVTFDLTGLPPTADELAAFENDRSPNAWATVVDRLLASPHYGERWGRHWLDVARYADTRDWQAQVDPRYPYAYTYRDWVILALNKDLPYNEFLRLQLAADHHVSSPDSPDLAALGFLTVGPRYRNNEAEQIADRIDVATRGLMGLTTTCARCHDHKYDPIPTADYYSLYGVFASSQLPAEFPLIQAQAASPQDSADYQKTRGEKQAALDRYKQQLVDEATEDLRKRAPDYFLGYYEMEVLKKESIRGVLSKLKVKETAMTPLAANLSKAFSKRMARDPVMRPFVALLALPDAQVSAEALKLADEGPKKLNPSVADRLKNQTPKNRKQVVELYGQLFADVQAAWTKQRAADPQCTALNDEPLEAVRQVFHDPQGPFALETEAVVRASRLLGAGRVKLGKLESDILEVDSVHPGAPPRAMAVVDKPKAVDPVIFLRGDAQRRGDKVPRRFLSIVAGDDAPEYREGSGRKELAESIVDPKNPLTARVMVNRVWMHHFGQGLSTTPGDFGLRGDEPSHPELLDWLSADFVEHGWSLKHLHRQILLSHVYRLSSLDQPSASAKDPENRLLWRANRRRLDFESMRDAMLLASGRLDPTVGGRPTSLTNQPYTTRRTVYGFIDRVNLDPIFSTFDFASPDSSTPQRAETLAPQQALFAMNHPFVVEQAQSIVKAQEFQQQKDDEARVEHLYQRLLGRPAAARERQLTLQFVRTAASAPAPRRNGAWQYGYGSSLPNAKPADRFHMLEYFTGKEYQYSETYPDPRMGFVRLTAIGGHAGRHVEQASVRRWTAPYAATVEVSGELIHKRPTGDGVRAQVVDAQGKSIAVWKAFKNKVETKVQRIQVAAGDVLDFVVDCNGNGAADTYDWAPIVKAVDLPGAAYNTKKTTWNSQTEFSAPPAPLLTAWEQAAQALMLTNEFMYLD